MQFLGNTSAEFYYVETLNLVCSSYFTERKLRLSSHVMLSAEELGQFLGYRTAVMNTRSEGSIVGPALAALESVSVLPLIFNSVRVKSVVNNWSQTCVKPPCSIWDGGRVLAW